MIITRETLEQHRACESQVTKFIEAFPNGCPVPESSEEQIKLILEHEVVRANWAWAVANCLIPAWSMREANLSGANLSRADLRRADLRWAELRKADLSGANLLGANVLWADLRKADLRRANLRGANLHGADLRKADLREADLRWADLRWADLPDGFSAEAAGAVT